jgi:fructose-1,6-bisphosphatase/inositol monophosphatase family enzyme
MIALPELDIYLKTGDTVPNYESRIYGISSSLLKEDLLNLEEGFEYRIMGCSMYNMYNVISGSYAIFQNPKGAHSWDILPGLNLAVENRIYNGEFLQPNKKYRFRVEH